MRVLLLSILLVLPIVAAHEVPALGQDDAGSGHDAGDVATDALPIAEGTWVTGALLDAPPWTLSGVDSVDWYVIDLPEHVIVRLDLAYEGSSGGVQAILQEPGGITAAHPAASVGERERWSSTITSSAGAWRIKVLANDEQLGLTGGYRFRITTSPAPATWGAFAGPGAAVLRVATGELGTVSAFTRLRSAGEPAQTQVVLLDGHRMISSQVATGSIQSPLRDPVMVAAAGESATVVRPDLFGPSSDVDSPASWQAFVPSSVTSVIIMTAGSEVYTWWTTGGGMDQRASLDHLEPASSVHAMSIRDSDGAGIVTPLVGAWTRGAIHYEAPRGLFFVQDCFTLKPGVCSASGPEGQAGTVGIQATPGSWRFTIDDDTLAPLPDTVLVYALDVTLPSG